MHLKRVIPCLDVDRGRVVKGVEFLDIRDAGDPVELAAHYDREGADELVFLDITATHERRETIVALARRTADEVFVPFTIGGGIRSVQDAQAVLDAGADKVSVNSAALARPELIDELAKVFGAQCVVLAIDAKAQARPAATNGAQPSGAEGVDRERAWEAYVAGGRTPSGRDVLEWAREATERGAGEILLTSMDRDGTSDGYDLRADRRRERGRGGARDRLRRRGRALAPRRCAERGRRRRAVRLDLPLRPAHDRRGQGAPRARRHPRAAQAEHGRVRRASSAHGRRTAGSGCAHSPGGERSCCSACGRACAPGSALLGAAAPCATCCSGGAPRELDVVVEGGDAPFGHAAAQLAAALASRLGAHASVNEHERFGTAIVEWEGDGAGGGSTSPPLAASATPPRGRCPRCGPHRWRRICSGATSPSTRSPARARRAGGRRELHAVPHALEDLRAGRLRVLHERSFLDDPTRLWRLARYRARLGFAVEERTAQLAADAVAGGALRTVSLARIGAELRLALGEADAVAALAALEELGCSPRCTRGCASTHARPRCARAAVRGRGWRGARRYAARPAAAGGAVAADGGRPAGGRRARDARAHGWHGVPGGRAGSGAPRGDLRRRLRRRARRRRRGLGDLRGALV